MVPKMGKWSGCGGACSGPLLINHRYSGRWGDMTPTDPLKRSLASPQRGRGLEELLGNADHMPRWGTSVQRPGCSAPPPPLHLSPNTGVCHGEPHSEIR